MRTVAPPPKKGKIRKEEGVMKQTKTQIPLGPEFVRFVSRYSPAMT